MAAKCKDGIVLLSIHVREQDDLPRETYLKNTPLLDNIGPVRIEQIDENVMLVNSGWRVDGHALADKGRELCDRYLTLYGKEKGHDFGRHIGWGLVDHLVECYVQESVRSLSTSGLLAICCTNQLELYLVDICGLFPCRALAIGSHAKDINRCLERVNFRNISVQKGADELLQILRNYVEENSKSGEEEIVGKQDNCSHKSSKWQLTNDSVAEVVFMELSGNIVRKQALFLRD